MLYTYPIEATENNWVHECLCQMLQSIHNYIDEDESPPNWPDIIPPIFRDSLSSRWGLKNRVTKYYEAVAELSSENRQVVIQLLNEQNKIEELLSCKCDCGTLDDLADDIKDTVVDLFKFSFNLLTDLEVRDNLYTIVYESSPYHVCPFCGCEYFDAPGAAREDLDHYLPKNRYPFAAANLRNLIPMGHKCNSKYKLVNDILKNQEGSRRKALDPYGETFIDISLDDSLPFEGKDGIMPEWIIKFNPEIEEASTWDEVFQIRMRYKRDVLDVSFNSWLKEFVIWCKSDSLEVVSNETIIDAIDRYILCLKGIGLSDRAFLKAAVFRMLKLNCENGNERLILIFRDLICGN